MGREVKPTADQIDEISRRLDEPGGTVIRPLAELEADDSPSPVRTSDANEHLDKLKMGITQRP